MTILSVNMQNRKTIKNLPDAPGVYLFYNSKKELIYVGKATSLRDRVRSYFKDLQLIAYPDRVRDPVFHRDSLQRPIQAMIHEVNNVKWLKTDSVLEAVIAEGEYIKKYLPKYNVKWRDDKSWNYIVITGDEFSKVQTVRERELHNLKLKIENLKFVFGPYPGMNMGEMMKLLRRLFFISTCEPPLSRCHPERHRASEVSRGGVEGSLYKPLTSHRKGIPPLGYDLGRNDNCVKPCFYYQLGQCLGVCIGEISASEYKRKVIRPLILFLQGKKKRLLKDLEKQMALASKREDYEEAGRVRKQLQTLQRIQDTALLNNSFFEDKKFSIFNFQFSIKRIEGYDISNLGESGMVGSMVVFDQSGPVKSEYRKFKIKTVIGQSDVDCLEEVMHRRLKHTEWPLPDIFLIDGGKPQVNRAMKVLKELGVNREVVGIAKGVGRKKNDFVVANSTNGRGPANDTNVRELLIRVRDEAHRFAIKYQRELRKI